MPDQKRKKPVVVAPSYKGYYELWAIGAILLYYSGLGLLLFLYIWADKKFRFYEITPDAIVARTGIIRKSVLEMPLESIRKVFVKQNFVQKYLDVGSLLILSSDAATPRIEIKYIENPEGLKILIAQNHRALRQKKDNPAQAE